jgi:hypothetical protein
MVGITLTGWSTPARLNVCSERDALTKVGQAITQSREISVISSPVSTQIANIGDYAFVVALRRRMRPSAGTPQEAVLRRSIVSGGRA